MDPTQAQIVMDTLDEIKAKILNLTAKAQEEMQAKEQDHSKSQETSLSNVITMAVLAAFEAWAKGIPNGNVKKARAFPAQNDLEEKAEKLIRELQESNYEQGEKILSLQMLLAELQAQTCPRAIIQVPETLISGFRVPVEEADDQNDSDSELQETPILTPPTPVSRGAASRIRILSDPYDTTTDLSTQSDKALDRISKLLSSTGSLNQAKNALMAQEALILGSQTENHLASQAQDTLQAKIAALEETLHSKSRHITDIEHSHEETIRLMTEQLDNVYSRLNPKSLNSTDLKDAQMEALEENNKELNKIIQQNIEESESVRKVHVEYIKELEKTVKELRSYKVEVLCLEKKLRERVKPDFEMEDQLENYKRLIVEYVPESMMKENDELNEKFKSLKTEMKTVRDELKNALEIKVAGQQFEHLAWREDHAVAEKSKNDYYF